MWRDGQFIFEGSGIVLLSEGTADRAFFTKLAEQHNLPQMDCPWPIERDEGASAGAAELYGKSRFVDMLKALKGLLKEAPEYRIKIKCVVIATDAGGNRARSFKSVKSQIEKAGGFPIPDRAMEMKGLLAEWSG